jgi:hypothetical protein
MTKKQKAKNKEQRAKFMFAMERELALCVARRKLATRMTHIAGLVAVMVVLAGCGNPVPKHIEPVDPNMNNSTRFIVERVAVLADDLAYSDKRGV